MTLTTKFLDAAAAAAERSSDPRVIPWPMPGNLGALRTFADFAEWRDAILGFSLPNGVPQNMRDSFDRALKIYLLAWIDFDLATAGEMAALSAFDMCSGTAISAKSATAAGRESSKRQCGKRGKRRSEK
jgi:hypothetical protein